VAAKPSTPLEPKPTGSPASQSLPETSQEVNNASAQPTLESCPTNQGTATSATGQLGVTEELSKLLLSNETIQADATKPDASDSDATNGKTRDTALLSNQALEDREIPANINGEVQDAPACTNCATLETRASTLQETLELSDLQYQEELHGYIERVDALEAKIHYISREATESARKSAIDAPPDSIARKLAEKDEKIVLLMDEGRSLASTEQKHRNLIHKLRSRIAEDEKAMNRLRSSQAELRLELRGMRSRVKAVVDLENKQEESAQVISRLKSKNEDIKSEMLAKDATILGLKDELRTTIERTSETAAKANLDLVDLERQRVKDLEESIATLKVEKTLIAERAVSQRGELNEKLEKVMEHNRVLELETKAEVQAMESKLEAMRVLVEEASSGASGDSQAKLLRQIETLQSQYTIASQNWQGIEASLGTRVTNLEKERDDAIRRESDLRRRARETVGNIYNHLICVRQ
jgi:TATA element modulatory factor